VFATAPSVISGEIRIQRYHTAPLETRGYIGSWGVISMKALLSLEVAVGVRCRLWSAGGAGVPLAVAGSIRVEDWGELVRGRAVQDNAVGVELELAADPGDALLGGSRSPRARAIPRGSAARAARSDRRLPCRRSARCRTRPAGRRGR
jgi:hypothetical protein